MPEDSNTAVQQYRDTSIAFDNMIVQVGRAIAKAQEKMDLSQVNFQKKVAQAVQNGQLQQLDINPVNAYTIPETSLELKIGMSMTYPEGGGAPTLSAVPLNATTLNQNDIDIDTSTELKLRFVSVPETKALSAPPPSALTTDEVGQITSEHSYMKSILSELNNLEKVILYLNDARLWICSYIEAKQPRLIVIVDDRKGEILTIIDKKVLPSAEELTAIDQPSFNKVEPVAAQQGEVLTIHGDNLLTLAGQTVLKVDGQPIPLLRLSMKMIAFKVPSWVSEGDVEIITPLGSTGEAGRKAFVPLPTFDTFSPDKGYYDISRQRGSWISILGNNLRTGCKIRFANGVESDNTQLLSVSKMQVEVPEGAGSGPLTLIFNHYQQSVAKTFFMLPRIERVSPRQARVDDELILKGNTLGNVKQIFVGQAIVEQQDFILQTDKQIRLRVPSRATDGPIRVREIINQDEFSEVVSRDIFYIVPKITGFGGNAALPDQLLTIYGEGLDEDPDMMSLLFDAKGGISEAPVLAVSQDRSYLTTRVPFDAVSGFVLLLRKRVYAEAYAADTSDTSLNKLTVLTLEGDPSDLIIEERFDHDLSRWVTEAGEWRIEQGLLMSEGTARLQLVEANTGKYFPRNQCAIYADVLSAEKFGFSIISTNSDKKLQVWINLVESTPTLTWSEVDSTGQQTILNGVQLNSLSAQNQHAQLLIEPEQNNNSTTLKFSLLLDQVKMHSYNWNVDTVRGIGLLADSSVQRWDNIIILKKDYLSLPQAEFYHFSDIPSVPELPPLQINSFNPIQGQEGIQVIVQGIGLDEAAHFYFGGVEAAVIEATGSQAIITVPTHAKTGPIEVHGRGGVITNTGENWFTLPPQILSLVPETILAGQQLNITGNNLPIDLSELQINVLEQPAEIVAATATLLTVLIPDVAGTGAVSLKYKDFQLQAPTILDVRREHVLFDLNEQAQYANWSTSTGQIIFNQIAEPNEASVMMRKQERMENGQTYSSVLFIRPPRPGLRALRGIYPTMTIPEGRIELRLDYGLLWSAAPSVEELADVDGVLFEMSFLDASSGKEINVLPRTACFFDEYIDHFILDAKSIAGKKGQLTISIFPGRTGIRDEVGIINATLVQLT